MCGWGLCIGTRSSRQEPRGTRISCSTAKGELLRAYATPEGRWRLPVTVEDVDPRFLRLLFAYEDKRYSRASTASIRCRWSDAAYQFVTNGRVVSGGSTITMQVARLLEPREHRTLGAKLRQIVRAVEIERALTQGRHSCPLPDARALWRQSRRRSRGVAGLFRQGAAKLVARGGGLAGRAAAVAGAAPAGPLDPEAARAARDRVLDRDRGWRAWHRATRSRVPRPRAGARRAQADADACAACAPTQVVAALNPTQRVHRLTDRSPRCRRACEELAL